MPENVTSIQEMFVYANTVSGDFFGVGVLIALYIIVFGYLRSKNSETSSCFVVAGFITSFAAIFFFLLGLIENWHLYICIFSLVAALIWSYLSKD
jgi:hypothetical protein